MGYLYEGLECILVILFRDERETRNLEESEYRSKIVETLFNLMPRLWHEAGYAFLKNKNFPIYGKGQNKYQHAL